MGNSDQLQQFVNKLKSGDTVCRLWDKPEMQKLPKRLRDYAHVLGPTPRRNLEALVDLGMTDGEIARYHTLPRSCIAELRNHWQIECEI